MGIKLLYKVKERVSMTTEEIRKKLFELQDLKYRDFSAGLSPTVEKENMIGVRTPALRALAKEILQSGRAEEKTSKAGAKGAKSGVASELLACEEFMRDLPHRYFDENQLHAFIISGMKDYDACMEELEKFLPYVDNWATCDQMSPKIFKKHKEDLLKHVKVWMKSKETFTIRFGVGMLMEHYLDEDFDPKYPAMVAKLKSDEYYVNMMIAWYFATALAKQYDAVIPYIGEHKLDKWTHNKTIQKAVESYRITDEQKMYLRSLKIR